MSRMRLSHQLSNDLERCLLFSLSVVRARVDGVRQLPARSHRGEGVRPTHGSEQVDDSGGLFRRETDRRNHSAVSEGKIPIPNVSHPSSPLIVIFPQTTR